MIAGAWVQAEFGTVAGDPEVCVLDVDGDDPARVAASDSQGLAGHHDNPVG